MSEFKVFLVDDDIKYLTLLKFHLEEHLKNQLAINIFAHGENSIDKLDSDPDLIILDYHLDGINERAANGIDIMKQILDAKPYTTVIVMTSKDELELAKEAYSQGAYDFVNKSETTFIRIEHAIKHLLTHKKEA